MVNDAADERRARPGSEGEHEIQRRLGSTSRADRFYDTQMLDHLNDNMREFVGEQEMFFLATADAHGECDNTFRAGPPGFLRVLDERTLVFPEYRGNGVHASLGNIEENPHLGILLVDFVRARIGLHINGRARIVPDAELRAWHPDLPVETVPGRRAEIWVEVTVEEAYIHCAKHIPQMQKAPKGTPRDWGTDDPARKGGDYFGVARDRAAAAASGDRAGAGAAVGRAERREAPPAYDAPVPAPAPPPYDPAPPAPPAPAHQPLPDVPYGALPDDGVPDDDLSYNAPSTGPGAHGRAVGLPQPVVAWQQEARRVLAEAEARGPAPEPAQDRTPPADSGGGHDGESDDAFFQGWFARTEG